MRICVTVPVPVLLAALLACDGRATADEPHSAGVETIDGVEIAWSSGPGLWGTEPIEAEHVLTIGELEGDPEYLLGQVAGVVADSAGRVYVLDHMASAVRVFDASGVHLMAIGRAGGGPGEFEHPFGLALMPDGDLVVRDLTRVGRFTPNAPGEVPIRPTESWPGPIYPPRWNLTERITANGDYLYPRDVHREDEPSRYLYLRFSRTGQNLDTMSVPHFPAAPPAYAWYRTGPRGGRILTGLNHPPFHPLPVWDATPRGTVISGDGSSYILTETGPRGDTLRRIERRGLAPERIPDREQNDSLAAMNARRDTVRIPLDEVLGLHEDVRAGRLRETYPAYIDLHAAPDGWIWVERWPVGGRSRYDVFSEQGRFLGTVLLPTQLDRGVRPYFTRDAVYGVVVDPETDVQRVVGFRFATP